MEENEKKTCVSVQVCAPSGCLQCQCEVFSPDGGGLAVRSVVSCAEERMLLWFKSASDIIKYKIP